MDGRARRSIAGYARRLPGVRIAATAVGAIVALSSDAWACPYCALSQGTETLLFIAAFLGIPYLVVTVVMLCMRRVLASEHEV
jgi:hypothetical protein